VRVRELSGSHPSNLTGREAINELGALRSRLREIAMRAGAVALRVTSAEDDPPTRERLSAALSRGDLATWSYDEKWAERASSPRSLLVDARAVVCVALAYATAPPATSVPLRGRVSNYAWSEDYHHTVRALCEQLAREIDAFAGVPVTRVVCDTAPLAERAFAERAGLGWIGKHTNLIVHGAGSFVFLGEVVTSVPLPSDAPLRTSCGSCRRCVDVCPTGALRGDSTIDATRCIADLTQRTDAIPRELRPLIGSWIWGCDLCQEVCPPTRLAGMQGGPRFVALDPQLAAVPLTELLALRSGEFRRRFRSTAMGWRGAALLRRNAAVALGNSLDRAAVPALERALRDDPHPLVRGHAAWALGRIASPRAFEALAVAKEREKDDHVCEEIAAALELSSVQWRSWMRDAPPSAEVRGDNE
jgi:epoxyqueuosine reductase